MRFSIDAHAIGCHLTGNEVYIRNLLEGFEAADRHSEFIAYVSNPEASSAVPPRFLTRRVSQNPFRRLGFDLPARVRADRPGLLHVQYTAPLFCPVPVIASVHDVSFLEHPEYFTAPRVLQLRLTVHRTISTAARIITGSEFSRHAIARAYNLDPVKITVVPNAASAIFRPLAHADSADWVRHRFGIPAPFILAVGDLQPRKNQTGLIRAFAEMLSARPQLEHQLVLVGQQGWRGDDARKAAAKSAVAGRIHFTGFVSEDDLLRLYNSCEFFVFPSFYEGFGLPVLEAMACGKPVACSNNSAVHEVAGACAILFDPHSVPQIVRAMLDLSLDPALRTRMGRLGLQRAAQFTWRRTAQKTLEAYYEVASLAERFAPLRRLPASVSR